MSRPAAQKRWLPIHGGSRPLEIYLSQLQFRYASDVWPGERSYSVLRDRQDVFAPIQRASLQMVGQRGNPGDLARSSLKPLVLFYKQTEEASLVPKQRTHLRVAGSPSIQSVRRKWDSA